MTMERTSSAHAKDRAHFAYECTRCGYILQVKINQPYARRPVCPRCLSRGTVHQGEDE